jgi:hypothetical protein
VQRQLYAVNRAIEKALDRQRGFTDEGLELSKEEVNAIHWDENAPTWEERVRAGERLKEAEEEHETILRAKERADYYSGRMESGDILSRDELTPRWACQRGKLGPC